MKVFTKLFVVAACALLAFSAVSCANNSNGGKGDLSGSNAISQSTTEYRYTSGSNDLYRFYFTSGSNWEYKETTGDPSVTTLVSKGTYSTSGSTVTFTTTWVKTGTLPSTTTTGTLSSDKKTLVVDGMTFTKQ
ncbi:MAG: hypothetical protein II187_02890 [Treponema sp.]|nr:hypothetical protein [Treponema sp.]